MYNLFLFAHVMLLVFWVGTDVGVFVLTRFAQSERYSLDQRMICLKVAGFLDYFPRICFVLILAVGAQLAFMGGWIPFDTVQIIAIWIFDVCWLALIAALIRNHDKPSAKGLLRIELAIQTLLILVMGGFGLQQLVAAHSSLPAWLALKLCAYASVCVFATILGVIARPMTKAFGQLASEGPSPKVQARLDQAVPRVLCVVLLIYLAACIAAFLGLSKIPG